jgi:hypothetical protein
MTNYVYRFGGGVSEGGQDRNLLGGKGANLDGMASIGLRMTLPPRASQPRSLPKLRRASRILKA